MSNDIRHEKHGHEHHHDDEHGQGHMDEGERRPLPCDGEGHSHHHHEDGSCCCHHHEEQYHRGVNKLMILRLALSALLFLGHELFSGFLHGHESLDILVFAAVALIAGGDVLLAAVKNLFRGRIFDEYFLMTFAAVAAFVIGSYHEGAAVMFLYRVGETFQDCAIRLSRRKIASVTGVCSLGEEKGNTERVITRFARIYTPIVLLLALLIALALPMLGETGLRDSVYRALTFLVVACPCSVVISVPMAYFAGIAAGAAKGIFFHDPNVIDRLAAGKPESAGGADGLAAGELVITGGDEGLALAKSIAVKARNIAFENIYATVAVKLAVIILGAFGISSLWFAVFADSGIAICLTLNSLRAFRAKGRF